jgi:hypothetical protein
MTARWQRFPTNNVEQKHNKVVSAPHCNVVDNQDQATQHTNVNVPAAEARDDASSSTSPRPSHRTDTSVSLQANLSITQILSFSCSLCIVMSFLRALFDHMLNVYLH